MMKRKITNHLKTCRKPLVGELPIIEGNALEESKDIPVQAEVVNETEIDNDCGDDNAQFLSALDQIEEMEADNAARDVKDRAFRA